MPVKKKNKHLLETETVGIQEKKSATARLNEIRKTGEYIRSHKKVNVEIKKAS